MNTAIKIQKVTLEALKGSIEKWEKIVSNEGEDNGIDNCPLCKLFYTYGCIGCPVKKKTGKSWCINTPYEQWWCGHHEIFHGSTSETHFPLKVKCGKCEKIAKKELMFLQSLLPCGKTRRRLSVKRHVRGYYEQD